MAENGITYNEERESMEGVQKRADVDDHLFQGDAAPIPNINIKICYGSTCHLLTVPSQSTFGDLKPVIFEKTGVETMKQRLFFRGIQKEDADCLQLVGVKNNSKLLLLVDDSASQEEINIEDVKESSRPSKGFEAVAVVRIENDKLADQVAALNAVVCDGTKVSEKDIIFLTEMLERQLLKLDGIEAEGEGRVQRKMEVRRIQSLVEKMDDLKAKNSAPVTNDVSVSKSDDGGLDAEPSVSSSTKVIQDWEVFE